MAFSVGDLVATLELNDADFRAGIVRVQGGVRQLDQMLKGFQRSASGALIVPTGLATGITKMDTAAKSASLGVGRLKGGLLSLAAGALGINPQLARLAAVLSGFFVSGSVVVGVLGGLALMGGAWKLFTSKAREAQEETQKVIDKLLEAAAIRAGGIGAAEKQAIGKAQGNIDRMATGMFSAESRAKAQLALTEAEAAYGDVLKEESKVRKEARKDAAAAAESLGELNTRLALLRATLPGLTLDLQKMLAESIGRFGGAGSNAFAESQRSGGVLLGDPRVSRAKLSAITPDRTGQGGGATDNATGGVLSMLKGFGSAIAGVLSALNPWQILLGAIQRALGDFLLNVTPIVDVLASALMPILKALFPIFKLLAIAATYVGQVLFTISGGIQVAVGYLIKGLGTFLDAIPFVGDFGLKKAGQALIDLGHGFGEAADELGDARKEIKELKWQDAVDPLIDAAKSTAEALRNVPSGFKIALRTFQATEGRVMGGGMALAGAGGTVEVHQHGPVYIDARSKPVGQAFDEWSREQARRQKTGGGGGYIDRGAND